VSRPADLEGLPWPDGEPGPLRSSATRLRGLAGGFEGAAGRLGGATPPAWSGVASTSYAGTLAHAGVAVTHLSTSLDGAAGALGHLADTIEHAQDTVRRAAGKLHAARAAAAKAQAAATEARGHAERARSAAAFSPTPLLPGDPLALEADAAESRALSAEATASGLQSDAAACARWAHGEADDAVSRVRAADRACAGALEGTGMAPGMHVGGPALAAGAQAVWDFVYDVAVKPLNPWDPGYTPGESDTVWGGYASGVLFGTSEWGSRYASKLNWTRYEPGYWAREPRWVAPYTRSTPSGGTIRVSGYMRKGVWAPAKPVPDLATKAKWASRAERFGKFGTAAAFLTAGVGQYFADAGNPNLNGAERTGRIGMQTLTVGGASAVGGWAGAIAGAEGGAAIGTMICPGIGTAVGTVVGGVVGGIVGGGVLGGLADHFNDTVVDWAGNAADDVKDAVGEGLDTAGKILDDITPDIDLTPW
jgi:uncharacterized protein YukE